MDYVEKIAKNRSEKTMIKLVKTLENKKPDKEFPFDPKRYVHNFSNIELDVIQLEALSLGPKFCDSRHKINPLDIDVQFENLFSQTSDLIPTSSEDLVRFKTTLVDSSQQYKNSKSTTNRLLTKQHRDCLTKLRKEETLIISKPDKGGGIVLMNKKDYVEKMEAMLNDPIKFQKVTSHSDINKKVENQLTNSLKDLKNKGIITKEILDSIKPSGSYTPRLYGLPKVHKPGLPLRPVLDMFDSPYHKIAKWLVRILEPLHKSIVSTSVKDVFDFTSKVENMNVSMKNMFSLDVVSLFTNVPLMETIEFICEQITEKQINIGLPEDCLKELLLRCTLNVHFVFNNSYYRQIDGIAMGSPLGPILADLFLAKLENGPLKEAIKKLDLYCHYIDDTFIVVDQNTSKDELLEQFNSVHPAISFTGEGECDMKLNFYDVTLSRRSDGSLSRSVYRKRPSACQYTHFYSFTPIQYKRNLVKCLTSRANKICSVDTLSQELEFIYNSLTEIGYPAAFIKKYMYDTRKKSEILTVRKKPLYIKLPFNGDVASETLKDRLTKVISRTFYAAYLALTFSSRPVMSTQTKDKLPELASSMCIYKFSCSCGDSYIGRTTRQLNQRMSEHLPAWFGKGQIKTIRSSILVHLIDSRHIVDKLKSFQVIYRIPPSFPNGVRSRLLHIAEAIGIRTFHPNLCVQKKFVTPLSLPWPDIT
ncbi:unnamed protein product [Schistosoma rodhaini]|uniref:Reverse transcriptase domain-containing protein n=1 Tax=Schistosoma rodhaini TaxID=6188 RepID=A0AA85EKS4_9TREM|nr:unnamed protein product [Schistosoma rodhaini]